MTYTDMVRSALELGPVLADDRARVHGVGQLIADAVTATSRVAPANTNLGIVLLFAPLARAAATRESDESLRAALQRTLAELTLADAQAAFPAIVAAVPGGLGDVPQHDVRRPPEVSLRTAMEAAADRDSIASEYVSDYAIVFESGLPLLTGALNDGAPTLSAIVRLHVGLLARHPDTLIARKAGRDAALAATFAAQEVLTGAQTLPELDALLRSDGHRLNPGTTADLVAATLLVALLEGVALP